MPRLDHVALQVADIDRAITFYSEVLGLPFMFKEQSLEHGEVFAYLKLEGGNLELLSRVDQDGQPVPFARPEIQKPYCPHVALAVDDFDAAVETLQSQGITLLDGPFIIPGKVRWLYFCDPDNNVLEYVHWL
jgi:catechol 2,3-dioxygenase-like lactoylglutathione lyase family enzyme